MSSHQNDGRHCVPCKGSGQINGRTCPACDGKGEIETPPAKSQSSRKR